MENKINAPHATEMQPELTVYVRLSACSTTRSLTEKLLVRVNVTSKEDGNWVWKSHSELVSTPQLAELPRTSVLEPSAGQNP